MPRYRARGVEATLSLADLESSLSADLFSRISEQRKLGVWNDVERTLTTGEVMVEHPIGADGSAKGVLQFIGPNEDMPHYAVEVRQPVTEQPLDVQPKTHETSQTQTPAPANPEIEVGDASSRTDANSSPSSMLSELHNSLSPAGDTLSSATPVDTGATPLQTRESTFSKGASSPKKLPSPPNALSQVQDEETKPKALVLQVEVDMGEYQNTPDPMRATDAKIEVWLNGCLVHASFIARIRSGATCDLYFAGTRIRQQSEKPWIFHSADQVEPSVYAAQERWEAIGKLLAAQVTARGTDESGHPPPSAQYLSALSQLPFPTRLKDQRSLGILDVVVTTGLGKKLKDPWGARVVPMSSTLHKVRTHNHYNTANHDRDHSPQIDSDVDLHVNRTPSEAPLKRQKQETTPSKADWSDVARRSKRQAGLVVDLDPDHFLRTPGEEAIRPQGSSPQKASGSVRPSVLTPADTAEPFKLAELCKGCIIGYKGPDRQRQVPQSRPGHFDENGLTVGFRFVVV